MALPKNMRAVRLQAYHEDVTEAIRGLNVVEQPLPKPSRGQVLVKIEATPCNPSDLLFLQGKYGVLKKLPAVPGWEGAGTVVASGGGDDDSRAQLLLALSSTLAPRLACWTRRDGTGIPRRFSLPEPANSDECFFALPAEPNIHSSVWFAVKSRPNCSSPLEPSWC